MYRQVYYPNHPRADVTGLVAEHILVAERQLGRPLRKGEIVHHKDFNKLNNCPLNLLFPISRQQHQKLPEFQAQFILAKGLYEEFLEFWKQAQLDEKENEEIRQIEVKIVKERNTRERLKGKLHNGQ